MFRIRRTLAVLLATAAGAVISSCPAAKEADAPREFIGGDSLRLLEPDVELATRKKIFVDIEQHLVDDPRPMNLYVLGSLYRRGDQAKDPAFDKNTDKAREYLSRAALGGHLPAMAKLSVLELEAKNRFEANVWAQLYFHYYQTAPRNDDRYSESFAAAIIAAAQSGFPVSERAALNDSVGMMIGQYDAQIRAGMLASDLSRKSGPIKDGRTRSRMLHPTQGRPQSGVAEFYVAFDERGSVRQLWLLDAWPDLAIARTLKPIAMGYSVEVREGVNAQDVTALLPIEYADQRHRVRKQD